MMSLSLTTKQKKTLFRILTGVAAFILAHLVPPNHPWYELGFYLTAFFITGGDILIRAIRNIGHGQIFDENFLMSLATIGAFFVGEYPEGVAVLLFYQIGELFQSVAVTRSRKSISELMDIRPDYANVYQHGHLVEVDPATVAVGELIVVKPGEKIPLDGKVIRGTSMLDTKALTGESIPYPVKAGSSALSGCINLSEMIELQVEKEFYNSTVNKILDLVENASSKKSKSENFISKFARYYTPCVVFGALALAFLPPLFLSNAPLAEWIHRSLIFLVISCPCALVISIPLSFFGGIGGASRAGILIKGSNYLETLAQAETIVFDKTGTLTKGSFQVTKVNPTQQFTQNQLIEAAALAESFSNHPISLSLKKAYNHPIDSRKITKVKELPGLGIQATIDGQSILVGNERMMRGIQSFIPEKKCSGTILYLSINHIYAGSIVISDELRPDAKRAIQNLKHNHIRRIVMLTGDQQACANQVGQELGIDEIHAELLPVDKVTCLELLLAKKSLNGTLVFVGDGINDAPVLSLADIGIAMGAIGSDAAIEAADIVLMTDEPTKIATAIVIAKRTIKIVKQNIIFALSIKAIVLILGALGKATMWEAVFADVGVSVIAILNAMRALKFKHLD